MIDMFTRSIHKIEDPDVLASQGRRKAPKPTAENPLIVSASELGTFLRCRVKHHWSYQVKLAPPTTRLPLVIGTVGHQSMQAYYELPSKQRNERAMEKIFKRLSKDVNSKELPAEDRALLRAMLVGYSKWANDPNTDNGDAVLGIRKCYPEKEFIIPLVKDRSILVRGKLDVKFTPDCYDGKRLCALESKFLKQIRYDEVENKLQLSVYLAAMRIQHPKFKRFMVFYQILRKQMPGPRVKAALFHREPVERDADEIDQWIIDTRRQAKDMLDGAVYPNPMDSCSWSCDFKIPCLLRGNKRDVKAALDEFARRT